MTQSFKTYDGNGIFLERINPITTKHQKIIYQYFPKNNLKDTFCLFSHLFRSHLNDYFVFDKKTKAFKGYVRVIPFMNFSSECEVIPLPFSLMKIKGMPTIIKSLPIVGHIHTEQGTFYPFDGDVKINPHADEASNKRCKGICIRVLFEELDIALALLNEGFQISFVGNKNLELSYTLKSQPLYVQLDQMQFDKTLDVSALREQHMKKIWEAKESYEKKFILIRYNLLKKLSKSINSSNYTT